MVASSWENDLYPEVVQLSFEKEDGSGTYGVQFTSEGIVFVEDGGADQKEIGRLRW